MWKEYIVDKLPSVSPKIIVKEDINYWYSVS